MKIQYFGTAAYEGVPALFCGCDVCRRSAAAGGRNLRTRQQALVDGVLLFDFNADTVCHAQKYAVDFSKIGDCLITHSHCDHLYPDDAEIAAHGYSYGHLPLHFYAAKDGYEKLRPFTDKTGGGAGVTLVESGRQFFAAGGKYRVLPLPADHDAASSPVVYAVEGGGKRMLYAHDTGVFPEETFSGLQKFGRLDFISFDCTGCLGESGDWRRGHMSLKTVKEVFAKLCALGVADEFTVKAVSHFSHNGGQTYDEMRASAEAEGYIVAYDGLEIAF